MGYKRKFTRLALNCQGDLFRGSELISCQVADLSEKGMLLRTGTSLTLGEELPFEFLLGPSRRIKCTVKIVREAKGDYGAQIVQITPEDQQYLTEHLDDYMASNFGRH